MAKRACLWVIVTACSSPVSMAPDASITGVHITSFTTSSSLVDFGQPATLTWTIDGSPDAITLDGASVLGTTTHDVIPARRQTFTLTASDGESTDTRTVSIAARGIDVLAGVFAGPGTLDGALSEASFDEPWAITFDAAGNAYVADLGSCTVREISVQGVVTTRAGTPHACDDDPGHFKSPVGIAIDPAGLIYVSDRDLHVIKTVASDGTVTTVAGDGTPGAKNGAGAAAEFDYPTGLLALPSGDILVADALNYAIRDLAPDHSVTTLYGVLGTRGSDDSPSTPTFTALRSLARDGAGDLFITDGCAVRRIDVAGTVSTYAGAAPSTCWTTPQSNAPDSTRRGTEFGALGGIAVDPDGAVYVDELQVIRRIDPMLDQVTTIAGRSFSTEWWGDSEDGFGVTATFEQPMGIAMTIDQKVAISDAAAGLVRLVEPSTRSATTFAGQRIPRGSQDGALGTNRIGDALGLAIESDGSVAFADYIGNTIRRVTPDGTVITIAGANLIGDADGIGADARFDGPLAIATDGNGTLYVGESSGLIRVVDSAGVVTTLTGISGSTSELDGPKGTGRLVDPRALVRDSHGNLIVIDQQNGSDARLRIVTPDGAITTLASGFIVATCIAIGSDDSVYVADLWGSTIRKVTPAGTVTTIAGPPSQAFSAYGLAIDNTGTLWIADTIDDAIDELAPDGTLSTIAGNLHAYGLRAGPLAGVVDQPVSIATRNGDLILGMDAALAQITAP